MLLCQTHIQTLECVESTHSIHSFRLEIAIAPPSLFLCLWIQEHKAASFSEENFNRQKWLGQPEALGLSWLFPDLHNANWPKHRLAIVIHFTEYYLDHVRCRNIKGFRILPNPPIQEEMKMR